MIESRKFKRFALPVGVKFRPTYGATEYATGEAVNLSCEGLRLVAHDFKFIQYENLELFVEIPGNGDHISLCGYIVWKKQDGRKCRAGVKFRMKDEDKKKDAVEKIFSSLNITPDHIYSSGPDHMIHGLAEKIARAQRGGQNEQPSMLPKKLGFVKRYCEGGSKCKVTFRLLREMAENAHKVTIAGDFNNWDVSGSEMTRVENGDYVTTLVLDSNKVYRFRYLIDGNRWENDWYADRYVTNGFGSKDSIVVV